jgi:Zn finger protein HypA/HybF involved in hydrogenase expression
MAYFKYKCKNCDYKWEGKKVGTKCPKCESLDFVRKLNKNRYELLDEAAERYAKREEHRYKQK